MLGEGGNWPASELLKFRKVFAPDKREVPAYRSRCAQAASGRGVSRRSVGLGRDCKRNARYSAGEHPPTGEIRVPMHPCKESDLPRRNGPFKSNQRLPSSRPTIF